MSNYEKEASIRPPVFDGTNFNYWKVRVTAYLQSLGTEVWNIVETGYAFPSTTPTDADEKKKYETNAKAVSTLLGCISQSEFMKVMHYKSAKEIWDKIVTSYEGDEQVKRAKLQTLRIQYETLKMYNDESVANYFLRVDEVVNCMKNLGEEIKEAIVVEKEKHFEKLEGEIVALRKEIEKTKAINLKFVKGSETLDEIINVQHSPLNKTCLGYTGETSQASTSKSYLEAAKGNEQKHNGDYQVKQGQIANKGHQQSVLRMNKGYNQPQVRSSQFGSRINNNRDYNHVAGIFDNRRSFFNGQCFSCHNFGHKAAQCVAYKTIMTRKAQKQRSMTGITKRTYNNFSVLENEVECSICNNFGHEDSECRSRFQQRKEQASSTKTWRIKEPQTERCGIAFYAEGQENLWYIYSGCSKHMTGDKEKLESYFAL
eukprot:PITA_03594